MSGIGRGTRQAGEQTTVPVQKTGAKCMDGGTARGPWPGQVHRHILHDAGGRLRQEQDPVPEEDSLVQVVGHEQHGGGLGLPLVEKDLAQPVADRWSSETNGSSSSSRAGRMANARASATRRR